MKENRIRTAENVDKGPVRAGEGMINWVCVLCPLVNEHGYGVSGPRCGEIGVILSKAMFKQSTGSDKGGSKHTKDGDPYVWHIRRKGRL
ncbi:MAG: hypothetical protein G01um101416_786 [Microgenomates group bacterium Gr01-1014_16]|nr:MAG: hypothetical protein G01um101416_786 [Microgenomates group bacterium Gr01-1014_16]